MAENRSVVAFSATILAQLAAILSGIVVARLLGPEGRGLVATGFAWAVVASVAAGLGIPETVAVWISRHANHAREIRLYSLATISGSSVVVGIGTAALSYIILPSPVAGVILSFSPYVLLKNLLNVQMMTANGLHRWRLFHSSRVIESWAVVGIASAVLLLHPWESASAGARAVGFAYSAGFALTLLVVVHSLAAHGLPARVAAWHGRRQFRRFALSNWGSGLGAQANQRLDLALMAFVVDTSEIGQYAVAVAVASPVVLAGTTVGLVALPVISGSPPGEVRRLVARSLVQSSAISIVIAIAIYCLRGTIIVAVFGAAFQPSTDLAAILLPAGVILSLQRVTVDVLRATGRPGRASASEAAGVFVLCLALGPIARRYGATGAAWVSVLTYATTLIVSGASILDTLRSGRNEE